MDKEWLVTMTMQDGKQFKETLNKPEKELLCNKLYSGCSARRFHFLKLDDQEEAEAIINLDYVIAVAIEKVVDGTI
jgi:hypothetical protein